MDALRRQIGRLETAPPAFEQRTSRFLPWTLGLGPIDAHLGPNGLARRCLHEVSPTTYGDAPAALGFAAVLALRYLARTPQDRRPLLWCRLAGEEREHGRLYGYGLEALGLPRTRLLTLTLKKPVSVLWAMEEALKSGALSVVIADAPSGKTGLTTTRRLSLAAAQGRSAAVLVLTATAGAATAAHTRWRVQAAASHPLPYDREAPGAPSWVVELTRARGGRPGLWRVEWSHAPHRFRLVAGLPHRAGPARPAEGGSGALEPAESALRPGRDRS